MKTFNQLTKEQQKKAVLNQTNAILSDIVKEGIRFDDAKNGNDLQARIDAAGLAMERNRTPWFWGEAIMDTCRHDIESMGKAAAESALYAEENEFVIHGIA